MKSYNGKRPPVESLLYSKFTAIEERLQENQLRSEGVEQKSSHPGRICKKNRYMCAESRAKHTELEERIQKASDSMELWEEVFLVIDKLTSSLNPLHRAESYCQLRAIINHFEKEKTSNHEVL